jgi:hypothetical protein
MIPVSQETNGGNLRTDTNRKSRFDQQQPRSSSNSSLNQSASVKLPDSAPGPSFIVPPASVLLSSEMTDSHRQNNLPQNAMTNPGLTIDTLHERFRSGTNPPPPKKPAVILQQASAHSFSVPKPTEPLPSLTEILGSDQGSDEYTYKPKETTNSISTPAPIIIPNQSPGPSYVACKKVHPSVSQHSRIKDFTKRTASEPTATISVLNPNVTVLSCAPTSNPYNLPSNAILATPPKNRKIALPRRTEKTANGCK